MRRWKEIGLMVKRGIKRGMMRGMMSAMMRGRWIRIRLMIVSTIGIMMMIGMIRDSKLMIGLSSKLIVGLI